MAIYSLNMRSVGRSTHAPRAAGAHLRYITRPGAQAEVMSERMPEDRNAARAWLDWQERTDRKNARVIDKLIMALPRELHPLQRRKLVREFSEQLTKGVVSWFAALHQAGRDEGNPHCHLVIRDRDPVTGKRVAMLSEKGACKRVRQLWEDTCNEFLRKAGIKERVSCRSHRARGIDRAPTHHRGPYRGVNDEGSINTPPKKITSLYGLLWPSVSLVLLTAESDKSPVWVGGRLLAPEPVPPVLFEGVNVPTWRYCFSPLVGICHQEERTGFAVLASFPDRAVFEGHNIISHRYYVIGQVVGLYQAADVEAKFFQWRC